MSCIFCKIAGKEVKSSIVLESGTVMAFDDISPQAPVHVVIIPKEHITSVAGLNGIVQEMFKAAIKVAKAKGVDSSGYRMVMNSGSDAGQAVEHMHFHLIGGRKLVWPPG